jgi:hypothetical protein
MSIQEFRDYMASGKPVIGGSDVHIMFHQLSQEALRITAEINGKYHTPDELHTLLEQLFGKEIPTGKYAGSYKEGRSTEGRLHTCKNKELLIIAGASHVDLYDDMAGVIPYDKMESFFRENLK